jgi:hypothetical protein
MKLDLATRPTSEVVVLLAQVNGTGGTPTASGIARARRMR